MKPRLAAGLRIFVRPRLAVRLLLAAALLLVALLAALAGLLLLLLLAALLLAALLLIALLLLFLILVLILIHFGPRIYCVRIDANQETRQRTASFRGFQPWNFVRAPELTRQTIQGAPKWDDICCCGCWAYRCRS
jgi:fatty acid desaturase